MLNLSRNIFCLLFSLMGVLLCVVINWVLFLGNYMGLQLSFELLNYDRMPLYKDTLIGEFFSAFFPETTIAQLFALAIASVVAAGLFFIFHYGFRINSLFTDRRLYRQREDSAGVAAVNHALRIEIPPVLMLGAALAGAIYWDVELFRYRSVAAASMFETADVATQMLAWPLQMEKAGDIFAWQVTSSGSWGYLGIVAAACLMLEIAIHKVSEYWARTFASMERLVMGSEHGQEARNMPNLQSSSAGSSARRNARIPGRDAPSDRRRHQEGGGPLFNPGAAGPDRPDSSTVPFPGRSHNLDQKQDVIGARSPHQVTLEKALANPDRYWVDPQTHEIWDAEFHKALFEK